VATVLILVIGLASLFSAILGYSRIPYAAAQNGDFFSVFAKVHPKHKFPHISLLAIGGLGFIFSLLFRLADAITAILTMRILVQFVMQSLGLIVWHYQKPNEPRPYKMPLFPLPAIISIIIWLFIYATISPTYILSSLGIIGLGVIAYFIRSRHMAVEK
jgi:amino acid transporter